MKHNLNHNTANAEVKNKQHTPAQKKPTKKT